MYQGIDAGRISNSHGTEYSQRGVFFLENEWKSAVEVSHFRIRGIPLKVLVAISGIMSKYQMLNRLEWHNLIYDKRQGHSLKEWREVRSLQQLGRDDFWYADAD